MQEYPNSVGICRCNKTENLKGKEIYVQGWRIRDKNREEIRWYWKGCGNMKSSGSKDI